MSNPMMSEPPVAPPNKSRTWLWILGIGLAVVVGFSCLCCGGAAWFFPQVFDIMGREVARAAQTDPAVQEHLGEISTCKFNFAKTSQVAQTKQDYLVFDVQGSKGPGTLTVKMEPQATKDNPQAMKVVDGELSLPDGRTFPLQK